VGGMCHYMLPRGDGRRDRALDGRYADEALQLLLMAAQRAGAKPEELQVKLFGGGDMFEASGATIHVSAQNVSAARDLARRHGLRVVSEDLGGIGHRHLRYEVGSGAVWVKHARRTLSMGGA